jgi:hypothetical protein
MIKSVDDLKKEILSVSGRVRKLENLSTDLTVKVTECESSKEKMDSGTTKNRNLKHNIS